MQREQASRLHTTNWNFVVSAQIAKEASSIDVEWIKKICIEGG
jgi:hypothetical protein